tara:strand:+ start:464 stop:586 length:123 start_codon:yes stop_codon:yes gene_type:complete
MAKKASFLTGKKTSNGGTDAYSEDEFEDHSSVIPTERLIR